MDKKQDKLGLNNMNGMTGGKQTCDITNMNCLAEDDSETADLNNMNRKSRDNDTTCSLNDMNCRGE